jgi:hypothetical protein
MKKFFFFLFMTGAFLSQSQAREKMFYDFEENDELSALGMKFETDKSPLCHNYTRIYESYFRHIKKKPIKFLEIGIFQGSSVRMWEEYFPKADLHFIDITYEHMLLQPKRASLYLCDQSKKEDLEALIEKIGGEFDVIIDDGGHYMDQQIISFETLFPHLKSGGLYVIEDLHTSYWEKYNGNKRGRGKKNAMGYLKNLLNEVNFVGSTIGTPSRVHPFLRPPELSDLQRDILSITFYDSLCFIVKR